MNDRSDDLPRPSCDVTTKPLSDADSFPTRRTCCFCDRKAKWKIGGDDDGDYLTVCHRHSETALNCVVGKEGAVTRV